MLSEWNFGFFLVSDVITIQQVMFCILKYLRHANCKTIVCINRSIYFCLSGS